MIVRDEQNAPGRQNADEHLPHKFCIWVNERFIRDFPNLLEGRAQRFTCTLKVRSASAENCRGSGSDLESACEALRSSFQEVWKDERSASHALSRSDPLPLRIAVAGAVGSIFLAACSSSAAVSSTTPALCATYVNMRFIAVLPSRQSSRRLFGHSPRGCHAISRIFGSGPE